MGVRLDKAEAPGSFLDGGPLAESTLPAPLSLGTLLENAAKGEHGCVFIDALGKVQRWSYRDLWQRAANVAHQLKVRRLGKGTFALLQLADGRDFLSATWGCFIAGVLPVPLAPAVHSRSVEKLNAVSRAVPEAVLIATAAFAEGLKPGLERPHRVLDIAELAGAGSAAHAPHASPLAPHADDVALLLVTSGSSGTPKLVALTHREIIRRTAAYALSSNLGAEHVTLNWMPLDHVGGLVMYHVRAVFSGAEQVQVATEYVLQSPLRWLDLIDAYGVNVTWAPNFAFRAVVDALAASEARTWNLSAVTHWINAGEMVVRATLRAFCRSLAPSGLNRRAIRPAWGMSETSSAVTENGCFEPFEAGPLERPVSVGPPIPGVAIRVVDEADVIVPQGQEGRLQVHGAGLTSGYWGSPERTQAAFTRDGWFRTGDLAVIKGGELSICAREDEVIIVNGLNHHPSEIEQLALRAEPERVADVVASGTRRVGDDTDQLIIFVVLRPTHLAEREDIAGRLRERVLSGAGIRVAYLVALEPGELPRTDSGKIQRRQLRQQFESGALDDRRCDAVNSPSAWPLLEQTWIAVPESLSSKAVREPSFVGSGRTTSGAQRRASLVLAGGAPELGTAAELVSRAGVAVSLANDLCDALALAERSACETVVYVIPAAEAVPEARAIEVWNELVLSSLGQLQRASRKRLWPKNLVFMTIGGQHVLSTDIVQWGSVGAAGLWGTLRVLQNEDPDVRVRLVDVDPNDAASSIAGALLDTLDLGERDDGGGDAESAYRAGVRYVRHLSYRPEAHWAEFAAEGKTIIIAGGLGGLGLVVAEHFARRGAGKIVLIARRDPSRDVAERLERCRVGTRVPIEIQLTDVTVANEVERAVARAVSDAAPVGLVIHAAGTVGDCPVLEMTHARAMGVIGARVAGALNLHLACRTVGYERLVIFSSVVGLLGYPGFASYAAACEMQQMLTARLRQDRFPVTIVGWPGWSDAGRAVGETVRHNEHVGVRTIDTRAALGILDRVIFEGRPQNQVLSLDAERWARFCPGSRRTTLLRSLQPPVQQACRETDEVGAVNKDAATGALPPSSTSASRSGPEVAALLASHLASVLNVEPQTLDENVRFDALGLTSMDALLFRDKIEREFAVSLTPGFTWRHPTLRELAGHLLV